MIVTRFAPSPNGPLHLGHAYAATVAHDLARGRGGSFRLRIEDIDGARSRSELVDEFLADMRWLGLDWDGEVAFQSARLESYAAAGERLKAMGLLYPCRCTRAEIAEAATTGRSIPGPAGAGTSIPMARRGGLTSPPPSRLPVCWNGRMSWQARNAPRPKSSAMSCC